MKRKIVGLTGSIGSGKSLAADLFSALGADIIDTDLLAREAVKPGSKCLKTIIDTFGKDFLKDSGELNRSKLADLIFADCSKRAQLEKIVHPVINQLFHSQLHSILSSKPDSGSPVICVVPLLFEQAELLTDFDCTVAVISSRDLCLERIASRDNCSLEAAVLKFDSQLAPDFKSKRVDHLITNNGTVEDLRAQIEDLYLQLTA